MAITTHRDMQLELTAAATAIRASGQNEFRAQTLEAAATRLAEQDMRLAQSTALMRDVRILLREIVSRPQDNHRASIQEMLTRVNKEMS